MATNIEAIILASGASNVARCEIDVCVFKHSREGDEMRDDVPSAEITTGVAAWVLSPSAYSS
jgi:hypothetical protein